LAQRFETVVGVEISAAMISEAQRNCQSFAVWNVEFVKSDEHRLAGKMSEILRAER
jgi:tRNA/tmRNA/rRNA uracil-C5-methylase (TrmA/RlmC/RlmD family)